MDWMMKLGNRIEYKTLVEGSQSIIGSSSKDTTGQLYTIETQFNIASQMARRNKRTLDVLLSVLFLILSPVLVFFVRRKGGFFRNVFDVFRGKKAWVGYSDTKSNSKLPNIRKGVLSTLTGLRINNPNSKTIERLNFWYAKEYTVGRDLKIIWKGFCWLGNS